MTAEEIQSRIARGLPDSQVEVCDTTGGGDHFEALVMSPALTGKTMVEQHRMVYTVLGAAVGGEIHALALRTCTPEQWEQLRGRRAT